MVNWYEQLTHWKSPRCWKRLRAECVEGIGGWDGWMASLMQWTWTWANIRRWWGTERPGVLQSMVSQKFRHNCVRVTEQQKGILLNINGVFIFILKTQFFILSFPHCKFAHSHNLTSSYYFFIFTNLKNSIPSRIICTISTLVQSQGRNFSFLSFSCSNS